MLENFVDTLLGRTDHDRQVEELEALDDHQLADMGLSRDQIAAYVRGEMNGDLEDAA
ncbi:MAG: DUF1127 domain-containing protein [Pseudomonadota bacterium]